MGRKAEHRKEIGDVTITDGHVLAEIARCRDRIAAGWQFLNDRERSGEHTKGTSIFSLVGTGLLTQVGWIEQGFQILLERDRKKVSPLVGRVSSKKAWTKMRHDAAHYLDRIFTTDLRGNDPDSDDGWHLIDTDLSADTIRTGNTALSVPELIATLDAFLTGARALMPQQRRLPERP